MSEVAEGRGILSSLVCLLKQCGKERAVGNGRHVHNHICRIGYDTSRFLANWIVQMYGECGCMEDAQAVFDGIDSQNIYSWSVLLTMYAQNGRLKNAKTVFERMPDRTVVPWNAMMTAYIHNGVRRVVVDLFHRMMCEGVQPDRVTFVCVANSCTSMAEGKHIHVLIAESGHFQDPNVGTSLLTMYGRCGCLDYASAVFGGIVDRDKSCWNAMMAAYSQNQHGKQALNLFSQMQLHGINPDVVSFVCVLDGCANLSFLAAGHAIHAFIVEISIEVGEVLATALVDMYGKCGSLSDAFNVFCRTPRYYLVSWNAIIGMFSQNGRGEESVSLFSQMLLDCIEPDDSTYVSVLTGCSHAGFIDLGWYYFCTMLTDCSIQHTIDHYACMVDLLGRAGHLDEAEHLLNQCPLKVDNVTWHSLLGACKIHFDVDRCMRIANVCLALDPLDTVPYVALFNISALSS